MKSFYLLPLCFVLVATVSCKSTKTASTNPYQNNPYYGPSGSTYGSTTKDYSSTPSSTTYPSYSEATYTPPSSTTSTTVPTVPSVPSYDAPTPTYSTSTPSTYSTTSTGGGGSTSHTVAGGENLYRISLKHGTSVAAIKSANGLGSDTIHPGQVLKIP